MSQLRSEIPAVLRMLLKESGESKLLNRAALKKLLRSGRNLNPHLLEDGAILDLLDMRSGLINPAARGGIDEMDELARLFKQVDQLRYRAANRMGSFRPVTQVRPDDF